MGMTFARLTIAAILLGYLQRIGSQPSSAAAPAIQRNHTCDFEPQSNCGWILNNSSDSQGVARISSTNNPPNLGPIVDANGNQSGHYFYFTSQTLSLPERILSFPSYSLVCGLSFSYYVIGPLDLGLLRENYAFQSIYMSQSLNGTNSSVWMRETLTLNATHPYYDGGLYFEVSPLDVGEAALEPGGYDVFLGLDDITLTFCLPCDYDLLGSATGGLVLNGPSQINVALRFTSQITFNATSSVCPGEALGYAIDSVNPPEVASIFSLDPSSGVLSIKARGDGLVPGGVQDGSLEVSVHIPGSDYTRTFPAVHRSLVVPFHQPPTITHTAPPTLSVHVNSRFSYQITVTSALGKSLAFGGFTTVPPELAADVSLIMTGDEATVSGIISLNRVLPIILENNTLPSISVPITDSIGEGIAATTQLVIEQSAPLFNQSHYEFGVLEGSPGVALGPIPIVDPNGDRVSTPMIVENRESQLFEVIFDLPIGVFYQVNLLTLISFDYEVFTGFDFDMVVYDTISTSLSSKASVRVNVLPVNEDPPRFAASSFSEDISDDSPVGAFVAEFVAVDSDRGMDGEITYSITSGNQDGFFEITGDSFGEIIVRRSPIQPHTYALTITATDGGSPPLSSDATLTVRVIATNMVTCADVEFGPPVISSTSRSFELPITAELTMDCEYSANPVVTVYKWLHFPDIILLEDSYEHYTVSPSSLTVHNLTTEDAGIYVCNVTNQCGPQTLAYYVGVIDYPDPPRNPQVIAGPDTSSLTLVWDPPSDSPLSNPAVTRPLDNYEVWVWVAGQDGYQTVSTVDSTVRGVNVTGLHPGTMYWVSVASTNRAGASPSTAINATTLPSVPKLSYLRASEQDNHSILVEWDLEYDGGSSIVSFEIHVILQADRLRRDVPDLIYHTDVDTGQLVTRSVQSGRSYVVMAILYNSLGSSDEFSHLYVGPKDTLLCDFESSGNSDCYWQRDAGVVIMAEDASPPLQNMDSKGNPLGHFLLAQTNQSNEVVVMSYSRAWYGCAYSFSYQLSSEAELILRTTSGNVIWSSTGATGGWVEESLEGEQFLTSSQDEGLQFVLQGKSAAAAIDQVELKFCLPCDLKLLESNSGFYLTYTNSTKLFLRTEQTLSLSAVLPECPSALLEFTTTRVVPSELESSFSLSVESPHRLTISVSPIPSDRVLPHTAGFIEVVTSVAHSDYHPESSLIERTALIEFILVQTSENCSFSQTCGFEGDESGCGLWELGSGVQRVTGSNSPVKELETNEGTFIYGDYSATSLSSNTVTSSRIADTYCAVSFSYSAPPTSELVISVDGLGQVWSSLVAVGGTGWVSELVPIDLQSVSLSDERELVFSAGQAEGYGEAGLDMSLPVYAALDDITLHPCIDCNTPECTFTSCTPGRYYSLTEESCISCPQGYYCPDWRNLPLPCPPGTYSEEINAASRSVCKVCPDDTYTLTMGSTNCQACPSGYSCLNSSHYPVSVANGQCPSTTPATSQPETVPMVTVIVGLAAGGVALLLCLLLSCVIGCWCYRSRQGSRRSKGDKGRRLLRDDVTSIGSAGSLGRSSVNTMSTFDGRGRRWRKGRDVSTLMTFLSDDEREPAYSDDTPWDDAEELTKPSGGELMFKNEGYDDRNDMQLVDVGNHENQQSKRALPTGTAHF